jgi:hypothetical protein
MYILYDSSFQTKSKYVMLTVGTLLGLAIGIETFTAMILSLWLFAIAIMKVSKDRKEGFQEVLRTLPILLAPVVVLLSSYLIVGMFSFNGAGLLISPYKTIIIMAPFYFILEYGPMLVFGITGFIMIWKYKSIQKFIPVILLGALSLFFILFLSQSMEPNFGVLKGRRILQLVFLILSGAFFEYFFANVHKRSLVVLTLCLFSIGIPSFFVDIYTGSNIWDASNTAYVSDTDHKACEWIKSNTPVDAVIQSSPSYPGRYEYSPISLFAERRVAIGPDKLASMLHDKVNEAPSRYKEIEDLLSTSDLVLAQHLISKYHIQYIYFGPYEKSRWPNGAAKFEERPDIFLKVYSDSGVNIYKTLF